MATVEQFQKLLKLAEILVQNGSYKSIEKLDHNRYDDTFAIFFDNYYGVFDVTAESLGGDLEKLCEDKERQRREVAEIRAAREARIEELSQMPLIQEWNKLNPAW